MSTYETDPVKMGSSASMCAWKKKKKYRLVDKNVSEPLHYPFPFNLQMPIS